MSSRIKQLLYDSGAPQTDSSGQNIGRQPDVGVALQLFDTFWSNIQDQTQYPELVNNTVLSETRMLQLRQQEGVGIICAQVDLQNHVVVGDNDPTCPEIPDSEIFPPGNDIAKNLDFDGDSRADLVSSANGEWKLDLSSRGSGGDNFGSWDLTISFPRINSKWVWPYTEDMNADGRTDIVMYDKEHGKWYIKFTTWSLLEGNFGSWDREIDYSATWFDEPRKNAQGEWDVWEYRYSRPHPGDYNSDGLIDIAIACSDGVWRIDYNDGTSWENTSVGTFDREVQYLDAARLAQAPGWGYLTTVAALNVDHRAYMTYKFPDGLSEEGRLVVRYPPYGTNDQWSVTTQGRYGGNETIFLPVKTIDITSEAAPTFKNAQGVWQMTTIDDGFNALVSIPPDKVYGGLGCHPTVGDFDGDDREDRAVMCPDGWRIVYTGDAFASEMDSDGVRRVSLGYNASSFTLPGRSYSGSISLQKTWDLIHYAQELNPTQPPSIPVDMVSFTLSFP